MLLGSIDLMYHVPPHQSSSLVAVKHAGVQVLAWCFFLVALWLRRNPAPQQGTPALPLILSAVGVGLIGIGGYLGGSLVYNHGAAIDLTWDSRVPEKDAPQRQMLFEAPEIP